MRNMKRVDDYKERREHLKDLSEEELYNRFWELTEQIVKPMVDLAYTHTSPSVERSVILRMGFSSLEAQPLIEYGAKWALLGHGMGNVILTYGRLRNIHYLEAGKELAQGKGWDIVVDYFNRGEING